MSATVEQQQCIDAFVGPVDVSAGAGSGKTFTLTERIAHALLSPESGVDDIDQVLAITFTKKAAAELKGRVRSVLRSKGLFDQALRVDGAWISTIHGMCSRILRACALELGIDPAFGVIEDKDARALLDEAVNEVLDELASQEQGALAELLSSYNMRPAGGFGAASVSEMVGVILDAVHGLPGGFEDLHQLPVETDCSAVARELLSNYEDTLVLLQQVKEGKIRDANLEKVELSIQEVQQFLEEGAGEPAALMAALQRCSKADARCGTAAQKEVLKDLNQVHAGLVQRAALCWTAVLEAQLLGLAERVEQVYSVKKRAAAGLDNNDLIKLALDALENPTIAAQYENKFRLVMVDEFQDTDTLQLAIIKRLTGAGQRYLCTVGDAQQSIYGFRGADVDAYRSYQNHLDDQDVVEAGGSPQRLRLTKNFRSHEDILAFVKAVCSQQRVFGQEFLDLQAGYTGQRYKADLPRITVDISAVPDGKAADTGGKAAAVQAQAQRIAEYFGAMRAAGHSLSDMVLLLGVTTNAQIYAQALRKAGFACVIAGGSLFAKAPEVRNIAHVARALVDPHETDALFNVLSGPLFGLSADDFLQLSTGVSEETGQPVKRDLCRGFRAIACGLRGPEGAELRAALPGLSQAVWTLDNAMRSLRWQPLSQALQQVLQASGYLSRCQQQGAEGLSILGNVMKAVRKIESLEQTSGVGPSWVARTFASMVEQGMAEAPGALNAAGEEAIRIMSIHASKGLEFTIVALADFHKEPRPVSLLTQRVEGALYAALMPKGDKLAGISCSASELAKAAADQEECTRALLDTASPAMAHGMLQQASLTAGASEEQRLFYVGATRAVEALGVFVAVKESSKDPASSYEGTYGDVMAALFADGLPPEGEHRVSYNGTQDALVRKTVVRTDSLASGEEETPSAPETPVFDLYEPRTWKQLPVEVADATSRGITSYSALAQEAPATHGALVVVEEEEDDASTVAGHGWNDADKATDFGLAFHRAAQLHEALSEEVAREHLDALARTYGLKGSERLLRAFNRWAASSVAQRAQRAVQRVPEAPFAIELGEDGVVLEGAMDLLCYESDNRAFVVDYKTGGSPQEQADYLQEKHGLQASCYAYVLLKQGFASVELAFVRVEQDDPVGADTLQVVPYAFDQQDKEELEQLIWEYVQKASRS